MAFVPFVRSPERTPSQSERAEMQYWRRRASFSQRSPAAATAREEIPLDMAQWESWSCDEVGEWLKRIVGLGTHAPQFKALKIEVRNAITKDFLKIVHDKFG